MTAQRTCRAEWCILAPLPDSLYCAIHKQYPPLSNIETHKDWLRRTNQARTVERRQMARAAESDAALAKRGRHDA